MRTNINLTANEESVLVALVENAEHSGDTGKEYTVSDTAKQIDKSISSVSMTIRSLAKKGMVNPCENGSYFDGYITDAGFAFVNDRKAPEETEAVEEVKPKKKVQKKTISNSITRNLNKVGMLHPNCKWVWREYRPGKFDWRCMNAEEKRVWDSIRTVHDEDAWFAAIEDLFGEDIANSIIADLDNNDFRKYFYYAMLLPEDKRKECLDIVGCNPEE